MASDASELRVAPQSMQAEACVLGAMILRAPAIDIVAQINRPEHFRRPAHALIFTALVEMRNAGKTVDIVFLRDELTRRSQLEQVGGVEYLVALTEWVPDASNAEYYARFVRDKAILREK